MAQHRWSKINPCNICYQNSKYCSYPASFTVPEIFSIFWGLCFERGVVKMLDNGVTPFIFAQRLLSTVKWVSNNMREREPGVTSHSFRPRVTILDEGIWSSLSPSFSLCVRLRVQWVTGMSEDWVGCPLPSFIWLRHCRLSLSSRSPARPRSYTLALDTTHWALVQK